MSGSNAEPTPDAVIDQMQEATDRLCEQAWMVAPVTSGVIDLPETENVSTG